MAKVPLPLNPDLSFVLPDLRVVYYSVPKAACTSIQWMLADLAGEDSREIMNTLSPEASPYLTIHHRDRWRRVPTLHSLPEAAQKATLDEGWFRFTVVREPLARVWSAWESKVLFRDPMYRWRTEGIAPTTPLQTLGEVADLFSAFIVNGTAGEIAPILKDWHFAPQSDLLPFMPDTRVRAYTTHDLSQLMVDLAAHLRTTGASTEVPELQRHNETPIALPVGLISDEARAAVSTYYKRDYEIFDFEAPRQTVVDAGSDCVALSTLLSLVWDKHARIEAIVATQDRTWLAEEHKRTNPGPVLRARAKLRLRSRLGLR